MAAKLAGDKRGLGPLSNEMKPHRKNYKVSRDGGDFGDTFELFEADRDMLIVIGNIDVKEAFLSGGAPTMLIGVLGGDADALMTSKLKAALIIDAQFALDSAGTNLLLKKGEKIVVTVGVADYTAGEIELVIYAHAR